MSKILVTGGAGFIGSHLVDKLIEEKHKVIIIDNLSSGREKNIHPKARLYKCDMLNTPRVKKIFKLEKPEFVFHLAAQINVRQSVEDPAFDAEVNILSTIDLLEICRQSKVKKFIFSSTGGAIYGDTRMRPTLEHHQEAPLSPYGIAKLSVEKYLYFYYKTYGLKYSALRYGNVYGPRQNPHGEAGVVAIFINKMLKGEQPIINGSGKQTRDYVYVADIVNANLLALENINKIGIYNVGTAIETSVNVLFKEINKHFDNKFKKTHGPTKLGEQKTSCLDLSRIKKELKWKPEFDLTKGIAKTVHWFRNND